MKILFKFFLFCLIFQKDIYFFENTYMRVCLLMLNLENFIKFRVDNIFY